MVQALLSISANDVMNTFTNDVKRQQVAGNDDLKTRRNADNAIHGTNIVETMTKNVILIERS